MVKTRVVFSLILVAVFALLSEPFVTLPAFSPISVIVAKVAHVLLVLSGSWLAVQVRDIIFILKSHFFVDIKAYLFFLFSCPVHKLEIVDFVEVIGS